MARPLRPEEIIQKLNEAASSKISADTFLSETVSRFGGCAGLADFIYNEALALPPGSQNRTRIALALANLINSRDQGGTPLDEVPEAQLQAIVERQLRGPEHPDGEAEVSADDFDR